jgi:chaperonin GroES
MNIEMRNGKILVEKTVEAPSSVIVAPEVADKKPQRGKVVAVGEGDLKANGEREVVDVMVGEIVVFQPYAPSELKVDGKVYLVIDYKDVLGVEEPADGT